MAHQITGFPGIRTERSAEYRRIRNSDQGVMYMAGGKGINGTTSGDAGNTGNVDVLRPGKVMAEEGSGGLWRTAIIGKTTAAYADNDTTLTVSAATATEVARLISAAGASVSALLVGPPSAAGTVAETAITITAASGTTLTIADLNLNKVTDSLIVPASLIAGSWCLVDDGTGIKLSDEDGVRINQQFGKPLIGGDINSASIIDWPADTSTRAWLVGKLNAATGALFSFDHLRA